MLISSSKRYSNNSICMCMLIIFLVGVVFQATKEYSDPPTLQQYERNHTETKADQETYIGQIHEKSPRHGDHYHLAPADLGQMHEKPLTYGNHFHLAPVGIVYEATKGYSDPPTLQQYERSHTKAKADQETNIGQIHEKSPRHGDHYHLAPADLGQMHEKPLTYGNHFHLAPAAPKDKSEIANSDQLPGTRKRLPQAMIIGVKKCGTQALTDMLNLHPLVKIARGEVEYFSHRYDRGWKWYRNEMVPSSLNQLTMEKSGYFSSPYPEVAERIRAMNSSILLLVIVKEPVKRAVSDYLNTKFCELKDIEVDSFEKVIQTPDGQIKDWEFVLERGMYAQQLSLWLKEFKLHQIHFVDGDKLITDPVSEITEVQKFLKLPIHITAENFYFNEEKGFYCLKPKGCMNKDKGRPHPQVDPAVISRLRKYFQPFNEQFYKMVGRDFQWPTS